MLKLYKIVLLVGTVWASLLPLQAYASGYCKKTENPTIKLTNYDDIHRQNDKNRECKNDDGIYYGTVKKNSNGHYDGYGQIDLQAGAIYTGYWKKGKYHGYGIYIYPPRSRLISYKGNWNENRQHGDGTMQLANGIVYSGDWWKRHPYQEGSIKFPDGYELSGNFGGNQFEYLTLKNSCGDRIRRNNKAVPYLEARPSNSLLAIVKKKKKRPQINLFSLPEKGEAFAHPEDLYKASDCNFNNPQDEETSDNLVLKKARELKAKREETSDSLVLKKDRELEEKTERSSDNLVLKRGQKRKILQLQWMLREHYYYDGTLDGQLGRQTTAAIKAFYLDISHVSELTANQLLNEAVELVDQTLEGPSQGGYCPIINPPQRRYRVCLVGIMPSPD